MKNDSLLKIDDTFNLIEDWSKKNDLKLFWYNLDSLINKEQLEFNRRFTSFDNLNKDEASGGNNYTSKFELSSDALHLFYRFENRKKGKRNISCPFKSRKRFLS